MKKVLIGILAVMIVLAGIGVWKGEDIINAMFYDMDAVMDLPENLHDDESLTSAEKKKEQEEDEVYVADVSDYLSLRAEPNSRARVLEKLPPLTQLEIISSETAPYVKVYVPELDLEGYVHEDYIAKKSDVSA